MPRSKLRRLTREYRDCRGIAHADRLGVALSSSIERSERGYWLAQCSKSRASLGRAFDALRAEADRVAATFGIDAPAIRAGRA